MPLHRTANWPLERWPRTRREAHFGRVFKCFAERPANLNAMFAQTLALHRDAEVLVCGDSRASYAELAERKLRESLER